MIFTIGQRVVFRTRNNRWYKGKILDIVGETRLRAGNSEQGSWWYAIGYRGSNPLSFTYSRWRLGDYPETWFRPVILKTNLMED